MTSLFARCALLTGLLLAALALPALAVTCSISGIPPGNPDSAYTDHGNGTLTDTRTGLMWKRCAEGQAWDTPTKKCTGNAASFTWPLALAQAEAANFAGHDDWRLPNLKELRSLIEPCSSQPAINEAQFPNTPKRFFWTSSPFFFDAFYSWGVCFSVGCATDHLRSSPLHARLVRPGLIYRIQVTPTPVAGGTVTGDGLYPANATATLQATPKPGWGFDQWTESATRVFKKPNWSFVVTKDRTLEARFVRLARYKLTVKKIGQGTVTSVPAGIDCGTVCQATFAADKTVTLNTAPAAGYLFYGWTGDCQGTACQLAMTGAKTATATFAKTKSPDLLVTAVRLTPPKPGANQTFGARVTVKNQGNAKAPGTYLDVWTDQPALQPCGTRSEAYLALGALSAGQSTTLDFGVALRAGSAGKKTLRLFVDSWCKLTESNEANNQFALPYQVIP